MKKCSLILFLALSIVHYNSFAENLIFKSPAFEMNGFIPAQYTCKGADQSPPLAWSNLPPNTQSLTLIVDDTDAPNGVWTHWVLFNIPPAVNQLDAGSPVPPGAISGKNSWGSLGYRGPCPSIGAHAYHFKLYALDTVLNLGNGTTKELVLNAMTGHVIGSAEWVGLYQTLENP